MSDDNILHPDFRVDRAKVVSPDLAPLINPKAGYNPLTAIHLKEVLELQTRLVLATAEIQTVTIRLQEIAQEVLDGDAG